MTHTQIIISIIIAAGLLGGLTNFFLFYNLDYKKKECWINFFKSILLSICASVTVPLFLQIISNNLLDIPKEDKFPDKNYFILAGFCVLAAFYSKRFLDDLYAKVNKAEKKAEEAKQIAENAEQKNQEIDDVEEIINETEINKTFTADYSKDEIKAVSRAILVSKYTYRTISGVAKDTNIPFDKVKGILELLKKGGFAESKKNRKGNDIYKIIYKE
jgi:negative regulator of replication initiation